MTRLAVLHTLDPFHMSPNILLDFVRPPSSSFLFPRAPCEDADSEGSSKSDALLAVQRESVNQIVFEAWMFCVFQGPNLVFTTFTVSCSDPRYTHPLPPGANNRICPLLNDALAFPLPLWLPEPPSILSVHSIPPVFSSTLRAFLSLSPSPSTSSSPALMYAIGGNEGDDGDAEDPETPCIAVVAPANSVEVTSVHRPGWIKRS